ncbi:efflux RND transporter periplasmic adaptor subunit [Nitrincola alkalilacustris]|uniref:efflux RND transporter periplasmic adaptor subunit n=1 Tax=Nitrincola alkalilacustris TaxID=1571224 RepID=UPI0014575A26|nr:efflux RND transporter periplasmic adaptor subunit [Nitrincola alkalilacustris]
MKILILKLTTLFSLATLLAACGNEAPARTGPPPTRDHLVEVHRAELVNAAIERVRTGSLRASTEVKLFTQEEGRITALPYYPGDAVKQGDLVAQLDDALLSAQLQRARAQLAQARQDLERVRSLAQRNLVSTEELLRRETELESARAEEAILSTRLSYTRILAPFDGVITERLSETGNIAQRYTHLLTLADHSTLVADVTLSELVLANLVEGGSAEITIDALGGGGRFTGTISRIYPNVDPITRRGQIEVALHPVPQGARPGQLVRVNLSSTAGERLLVPFSALRFDQNEYMYVIDDAASVVRKPVVTGLRIGDQVEVLQGIEPGDKIVTRGFLGLTEGREVRVVTPLSERQET